MHGNVTGNTQHCEITFNGETPYQMGVKILADGNNDSNTYAQF